ncbi:MAG TPA: helix-turn-helix domain-containing protein, partial [bacterium]|nr:helix-turn-helix domain-containing protein [bacterium]
DLETRVAILKKKALNESFMIPDEILYLIASKIRNNIRIMEGALIGIAAYASLTGKELTPERSKEYLKTLIHEEEEVPVNIDKIQRVVSKFYNITAKEMISRRRNDSVAFPRMLAMYLTRTMTNLSTTEIGSKFGGRDHSTVMHASNKIQKQLHEDPFFNQLVNKIVKEIKEE